MLIPDREIPADADWAFFSGWFADYLGIRNGNVEFWFDGLVHALSYNPTQGEKLGAHLIDAIKAYGFAHHEANGWPGE